MISDVGGGGTGLMTAGRNGAARNAPGSLGTGTGTDELVEAMVAGTVLGTTGTETEPVKGTA